MNLNLSKLNNTNTSEEQPQVEKKTKFSFANISKNAADTPVAQPATNFSLAFAAPKEPEKEAGFSISFTDNKVYDLDDIIFKKRRDNAKCPLIVYVDLENKNDERIIKQITLLILDDYGVAYNDDNYKTQIQYVPQFSDVFDTYFNQFYQIYHDQYEGIINGSISLGSALNQIVSLHDELKAQYGSTINSTYINTNSFNKPHVEWENGTVPGDEDIDNLFDLPEILKYVSLDINGNVVSLKYDGTVIPNSSIEIPTGSGEGTDIRVQSEMFSMSYPIDIAYCTHFTPVRLVKITHDSPCLVTSNIVNFGGE